jgi:hypothetical protein
MQKRRHLWKWRAHQKHRALSFPGAFLHVWPFSSHIDIKGLLMCINSVLTGCGSPAHAKYD